MLAFYLIELAVALGQEPFFFIKSALDPLKLIRQVSRLTMCELLLFSQGGANQGELVLVLLLEPIRIEGCGRVGLFEIEIQQAQLR
jgi:hypothetical protein